MSQLSSHQFKEIYNNLGINLDMLGCITLDLEPITSMKKIDREVQSGLYYTNNKDKFWINGWVADKEPHITLLHGLLEKGQNYKSYIRKLLKDWHMDSVEIEDVGYFESPHPNEDYYCIVAHIKRTPELLEGRHRLELLPHINVFTGYVPHMTICYIKKDDRLRDMLIEKYNAELMGKRVKVKRKNLGR